MITLGLLIGSYTYCLLIISFAGILYKNVIIILTLMFFAITIFIWKSKHFHFPQRKKGEMIKIVWQNKFFSILVLIVIIQICINLLGALSPETAFDALWYHLTLAKIYAANHKIIHIPGGVLYYSDMPKLIEILYAAVLSFGNEIKAKIIHFLISVLLVITIYTLTKRVLNKKAGILAAVILTSNIVFAWEATTAYIDLGRSFFELLALWGFLTFTEKKEQKWLIITSIFLGLAITTKVLAISSLVMFVMLYIGYEFWGVKHTKSINYWRVVRNTMVLIITSLLIPLPWFIFSFIHTGNPVFPFFTQIYQVKPAPESVNIIKIGVDFWNMILYSSDPISPLYLIFFPLVFFTFSTMDKRLKIVTIYSGLSLILWFITPRTGGGRFILPYLSALSISAAAVVYGMKEQKQIYNWLLIVVFLIAISTCIYRGAAEKKYLPVLFGNETKTEFLKKNLNFEFGDFYDIDGYFAKHIKPSDKVLLYGFHNLYYIDFPFIDSSWVKNGDSFNYIALQNATLPKRFSGWEMVYQNKRTHVKLFTKHKELWTY